MIGQNYPVRVVERCDEMRRHLQRPHRSVVVVNLGHVTFIVRAKNRSLVGEFPLQVSEKIESND